MEGVYNNSRIPNCNCTNSYTCKESLLFFFSCSNVFSDRVIIYYSDCAQSETTLCGFNYGERVLHFFPRFYPWNYGIAIPALYSVWIVLASFRKKPAILIAAFVWPKGRGAFSANMADMYTNLAVIQVPNSTYYQHYGQMGGNDENVSRLYVLPSFTV